MSSKRSLEGAKGDQGAKKKRLSLTIMQKVELLKNLDRGVSVRKLCEIYGVGSSTVYDLKKQKVQLFSYFAESDCKKLMAKRKHMKAGKYEDLETCLMEWFRQVRSEGVKISGDMILEQASIFFEELKIEGEFSLSTGWLDRFKKRHGISEGTMCSESKSADHESATTYGDTFDKLVQQKDLSADQVYNTDETTLHWHCLPHKTLEHDEEHLEGFQEPKDQVAVSACSNAAGAHRCKQEIARMVMTPEEFQREESDDDNDEQEDDPPEKISLDRTIELTEQLISALEQHSFITEQQIMQVYNIQACLIKEKPKYKQTEIQDLLKKMCNKTASHVQPLPSPSSAPYIEPLPGPSSAPDCVPVMSSTSVISNSTPPETSDISQPANISPEASQDISLATQSSNSSMKITILYSVKKPQFGSRRIHRNNDRKGNISPTADDETSQYCEAGVVTDVVENPKDPEGLDRKGIISPTADDRISQCCEAGVVTDVAENPKDPKGLVKRRHSSNGSVELHSDSMKRKPFKSEISADEYTISKEWEFVEIKKEPNMLKDKCDENYLFHVSVKEEPIGDTMEFVKQEHDI